MNSLKEMVKSKLLMIWPYTKEKDGIENAFIIHPFDPEELNLQLLIIIKEKHENK